MKVLLYGMENIVGKGENAGNQFSIAFYQKDLKTRGCLGKG